MTKKRFVPRVRRLAACKVGNGASQCGVTLIELMVGLVVGSLVVLAITTIYITTVGASNATLSSVRLNQDLRSAMLIMSSDIRRAGYWNQNLNAANPFAPNTGEGFQLGDCADEGVDCSRIDYAFDRDRDGMIGPNEVYGFRLNEDNAIQMLNPDANGADDWVILVGGADDPLTVNNLSFSAIEYQCINISMGEESYSSCNVDATDFGNIGDTIQQKRRVRIFLEGQIGDQTIQLEEIVRLRNDRRFTRQ